ITGPGLGPALGGPAPPRPPSTTDSPRGGPPSLPARRLRKSPGTTSSLIASHWPSRPGQRHPTAPPRNGITRPESACRPGQTIRPSHRHLDPRGGSPPDPVPPRCVIVRLLIQIKSEDEPGVTHDLDGCVRARREPGQE